MGSLSDQLVKLFTNSGASLPRGSIVRPSGNGQGTAALAGDAGGLLGVYQSGGAALPTNGRGTAIPVGEATVLLETGLSPSANEVLYLSDTTAGRATTVRPATPRVVGVISDAGYYGVDGTVRAVVVCAATGTASGASLVADWDDVRFFFIDNENGDDANLGYIDAAPGTVFTPAQTSAVAIKTAEQLRNILPRVGAGRRVAVLFRPRSDNAVYKQKDGVTEDYIDGAYSGYVEFVMRGSDLTNSVADKTQLGYFNDAEGPNADGSWTVGTFTAPGEIDVADNTGFPASAAAMRGRMIIWKGNVTGALTAFPMMIVNSDGISVLTMGSAPLGGNPATNDEFFVATPGVRFNKFIGRPGANGNDDTQENGAQFVGFRFEVGLDESFPARVSFTFTRWGNRWRLRDAFWGGIGQWRDESHTRRFVSHCVHIETGTSTLERVIGSGPAWFVTEGALVLQTLAGRLSGGIYIGGDLTFAGCAGGPSDSGSGTGLGDTIIANFTVPPLVAGAVNIDGSPLEVLSLTTLNTAGAAFTMDAKSALYLEGEIDGSCTTFLSMIADARANRVFVKTTPTATVSGNDIVPIGLSSLDFADVALASYEDSAGNTFQNGAGVTNQVTPAQLTANANNYNPAGWKGSERVRVSSDASRDITGALAIPTGPRGVKTVINIGANDVVLKHADGGSSAGNQFLCPGGVDLTLAAGEAAQLIYDTTDVDWRVFALS